MKLILSLLLTPAILIMMLTSSSVMYSPIISNTSFRSDVLMYPFLKRRSDYCGYLLLPVKHWERQNKIVLCCVRVLAWVLNHINEVIEIQTLLAIWKLLHRRLLQLALGAISQRVLFPAFPIGAVLWARYIVTLAATYPVEFYQSSISLFLLQSALVHITLSPWWPIRVLSILLLVGFKLRRLGCRLM